MSFKKNLLKKIEIKSRAADVLESIESGRKIDRDAMRRLLELGPFAYRRERDLDLYLSEEDGWILVLDNDLPIYRTTAEDVGLRKSPTLKEMLGIRSVVKILNDADVLISKREKSVETVRGLCIDRLDLSFTLADIEAIARDGAAAFENGCSEGAIETLTLFAEILGYTEPPPEFIPPHHKVFAGPGGPFVLYGWVHGSLKLISPEAPLTGREAAEQVRKTASGELDAIEGSAVFEQLKELAALKPAGR
jgi:hypothetical protein